MSAKYLGFELTGSYYYGIPSATKGKYGYRIGYGTGAGTFVETTNVRITKLQKRCGGGDGGGSTEQGYIEPGFENFPKEVVCTYNGSNNKIKFKLEAFYDIDKPSSAMAYYLSASTINRWTMIV